MHKACLALLEYGLNREKMGNIKVQQAQILAYPKGCANELAEQTIGNPQKWLNQQLTYTVNMLQKQCLENNGLQIWKDMETIWDPTILQQEGGKEALIQAGERDRKESSGMVLVAEMELVIFNSKG